MKYALGRAGLKAKCLTQSYIHDSASTLRDRFKPEFWNKALRVAVVRNPWDRLASRHAFLLRYRPATSFIPHPPGDFKRWVMRDIHPMDARTQSEMIDGDNGEPLVSFVGKYEYLQTTAGVIGGLLGVRLELPRMNAVSRPPYQDVYDNESQQYVAEKYAKDVERWQYVY